MNHRGVFITGTDTNVGKTVASALLASALKQGQKQLRYFKPIQTGTDSDTDTVVQLVKLKPDEFSIPVYQFPEPMAPNRAALINGVEMETGRIKDAFAGADDTAKTFWIVEGAGGLLVPINSTQTIRDLVLVLSFPLIVVASTRLGTINHTLLTIEAARAAGCRVAGLILNGETDPGLEEVLTKITAVPLLGRIHPQPKLDPATMKSLALKVFSKRTLHSILSSKGVH